MVVAVFAPGAAANYTWNGTLNNAWSLAGSDTNWSLSGSNCYNISSTYYSNIVNTAAVTFPEGAAHTNPITIAAGGVQPGSVTFTNSATSYTFGGGAISGSASVVLNGTGNVTLNNANTYTGGTMINAGTLRLGNANALQNSGVTVNVANGMNFSPGVGTFNLVSLSGSGSLPLSDTGGGGVALSVGGNGVSSTFSGSFTASSGTLVKVGSGSFTLSGNDLYSGGTTLSAGKLVASGTSPFGIGGLRLCGGTLALNANVPGLLQGLLGPGGNWANWTGTPTGGTVTSGFYYANIGQTVQTNGDYAPWYQQSTWVYSGEIYIPGNSNGNKVTFFWNIDDAAQLKIDGSLFQGQTPQWEAIVTGVLTPGWHSIEWRGSNNGGPGGATGGNGAPYGGIGFGWDPNGGTAIVAMPNDPGNGSLYQTPGSISLPNAVTVAAESTIDLSNAVGGRVTFPSLTIGDNTLHLTGGSGAVGGTISISGSTLLTGGTAATFDVQNANVLALNGAVAASGSSALVKAGAGTLVLANTASTYSGGTSVNGGVLVAVGPGYSVSGPATGPLGSGTVSLNNTTLVLAAASTAATTFDLVTGNTLTLTGSSDAIIAGSSLAGVANGTITLTGSGAVPIAAGQTLNLGTANGYTMTSGPTFGFSNSGTISGGPGSVSLNLAVSAGTVTAGNNGTLTVLNAVSGGYFAPAATGTVVLGGSYSGLLGNLAPASGGTLVVNTNVSSGTLNVVGGAFVAANSLSFGPATLLFSGGSLGAATALTGSNAIANSWTIPAGSAAYFNGNNALELSASTSLAVGSENIHLTSSGLGVTLSGLIGGSGGLVRASDTANQTNGTLIVNNPGNTFSGGFTLQSYGGNVNVQGASTVTGSGGSIVSGPLGTGAITIGSSNNGFIGLNNSSSTAATLANPVNFYDGCAFTSVSGLTFSGPVTLTGPGQGASNNGVMDIWLGANSNIAFGGVISGVAKGINLRSSSGTASLTLSGSNTYSGTTSITMGTLLVAGNAPNGASGALGNATSAITIGDASSTGNAAALLTTGAYAIARPITVNATAGPTTLGTTASGVSTYAGAIIQNNATPLALSSPAGGSVVFSGNIAGSGGVTVAAPSTIVFSGSNSYTGATAVNGGNLTLDFTNSAVLTPATNVVCPSSALTLNSGTLNINGQPGTATSQTFASLTVSGGASTINVNPNGGYPPAGGGVTVNLGPITRGGQATIDLPGGVPGTPGPATFSTNGTLVNGIAGGFVTVNGTDWLAGSTPTPPSTYAPDDFSAATNNVDVVSGGTANFTGPSLVNSLRFSSSSASALTLPGALTLTTGGILVTPNVSSSALAITGGSLTASGGTGNPGSNIVVQQFNTTTPFTIGSAITNSGTTAIGLTKSGPGTLILAGSNTFSGPTTVNAGSLQGSIAAGSFPTNIAVNAGGNVTFLENGAAPLSSGIAVSGAGTLTKDGSQTLTLAKNIFTAGLSVVNGTLNLGAVGGQSVNCPVNIAAGATLGTSGGSAGNGLVAQFFTDTVNYDGNQASTRAIFANPTTMINYYTGGSTPTLTTPTLTTLTSANNNAALHFYGNFQAMAPSWANGSSQAIILSGNINIANPGSYQFGTNSDNGSMLWIDGNQVVNNNNFQGQQSDSPANNQATGTVNLTAGMHNILIGFYQGTGGEGLNVNYNYNNTGWNYLPNSMLNCTDTIGPLSGAGTLNVAGALTENATAGSQFDGVMAGSGVFLKSGTGRLVLTGSNSTYSGTVRIAAGTLQLNSPLALQAATLDLEAADAGTLDTSTAGLASLTLGGLMGSQNLVAPAGPLVVGGNGASTSYTGNLSGATSLTKTGTGILALSSTGSTFGNTTISGGAIQISNGAVLANSAVTVNASQGLIFGSGVIAAAVGGLSGSGSVVLQTLDYAAVTLTAGANGQNTTFSGALGGSGSLWKTGSGTLTLTSIANNYSGALIVNNGVLEVAKLGDNFNGSGPITLGGSGPATLRYIGANDSCGRTINLAGNAALDASETSTNPNNNLYFSGPINGAGHNLTLSGTSSIGGEIDNTINLSGGSLTKNGNGAWLLDSHPNNIAGTIVNAGTLWVDSSSTGGGPIVVNGGTLASVPYGPTPVTLGSSISAGTGPNAIQPGGNGNIGVWDIPGLVLNQFSTLAFDIGSTSSLDQINDAGNLGFSGSGAAGVLVSNGSLGLGTYKLMTYSPTSSISLADFSLEGLIGGGAAPAGYQLQLNAGELDLSVGTGTVLFSGSATWTSTGGTTWNNGNNWTDGNSLHGVPGVNGSLAHDVATFSGSASTVSPIDLTGVDPDLKGLNFSAANYVLSGGSLTLDKTGSGTATVTVSSGTQTISSTILGSVQFQMAGNGSLILSGSNGYTGGTAVDDGTLYVTDTAALPDGTSLTVGAGGTFVFDPQVSASAAVDASLSGTAGRVDPVPEPGTLVLLAVGAARRALAFGDGGGTGLAWRNKLHEHNPRRAGHRAVGKSGGKKCSARLLESRL